MNSLELNHRLQRHEVSEANLAKMEVLRKEVVNLANTINALAPDSREKSLAFTHLEDALMWANKAISTPPYIRIPEPNPDEKEDA